MNFKFSGLKSKVLIVIFILLLLYFGGAINSILNGSLMISLVGIVYAIVISWVLYVIWSLFERK